MKKNIWTISATNINEECEVLSMPYAHTYYTEEEAIDAAKEFAQSLADDTDVINVSVFGGEYETEDGDILGEPFDIYTISNKDKWTTMQAREDGGYVALEVDDYIIK